MSSLKSKRISWFLIATTLFMGVTIWVALPRALAQKMDSEVLRASATESLKQQTKWFEIVNFEERDLKSQAETECLRIASNTLYDFSSYLDGFKSLEIHKDSSKRRGLSNGETIYLRCLENKEEYLNVLLHELGHSVDILYLNGDAGQGESNFLDFGDPVFKNDPSVEFYALSWNSSNTLLSNSQENDFVSRYASTDPFEDFAESFIFYVRYGEVFRYLIANPANEVLKNKYDFLKEKVFAGKEFNLDKSLSDKAFLLFSNNTNRVFDVTKLPDLV